MNFQDSTGRTCSAKLKHALYVPSYPCDIFSVHNGSSVLFKDNRTVLKTKDGTVFDINKAGSYITSQLCSHQTTAKGGFRYAICFVDDYSGFVSHYFLRNKSDATRATVQFLADVSAIGTVKVLKTDNGGEYTSNEFKDLLAKHAIKHEMSAPHTPSQNGTAERWWRTGFDMVCCVLLASGLPKSLWTYALLLLSCHQTAFFHLSTHFLAFSLNF